MTRIEYFLAWPHARVAQLVVDQEAQIKLLKELLAEYRAALTKGEAK